MYLEVLLTNYWMEDNLEIHLKEIHSKEIHLEDHHLIHMLDLTNAQHLTHACLTTMVSTTYCTTCTITNNQAALQEPIISNLCQRH
jgi:hypothetical protein